MSEQSKHLFQFSASAIAGAAKTEAEYHEQRVVYWQAQMDSAYKRVEETIGAKISKSDRTGGWDFQVVVDYGDPAASQRLSQATHKVQSHQASAARFRSDERLYGTQGEHVYDLDADDVAHFRLGGQPRDD